MILVTGGAGYIGSHTCIELLAAGYEIAVLDDYSNSRPEAVKRVQEIAGKTFPVYEGDVRDEALLDKIFKAHDISCIIHFAGLKAVGESVSIPVEYYDNNLNSSLALCKAMKKHNTTRLIFSSSATVYKDGNPMPLDEESDTGCTNPYGWTKYMSEQIFTDAAKANEGWTIALLRYFNPIGAHASGKIGEDPKGIPNNLMPFITQTAIGKIDKLQVFGDDYDTPDGTGVRDYIHVVDLAKGHVAAVAFCEAQSGVHAINLGTGNGTSVLEMVQAFEKVTGVSVPRQIVARRPGDIATCYASCAKAERLLGWKAEKTLEDMVKDSWFWQNSNPNGYEE
ncbi:MAG: UDP-glucose 4-epimerase GalE [Clostridiales bacterium]|jgi:UDP-glucose 4-epimerase|nr:UDP-glucose 4-epimerase GalE [Clostridiales bacterium]